MNRILPIQWNIAKGEDLFSIIRGVTYRKQDVLPDESSDSIVVLRAGNLQKGRILFDDIVFIPNHLVNDTQRIRAGDLIVAMSSGSASVVGKVSYVERDYINVSFGTFCGLQQFVGD